MHVQKPKEIEYVGRGLYRSENLFSDPGQGQYMILGGRLSSVLGWTNVYNSPGFLEAFEFRSVPLFRPSR